MKNTLKSMLAITAVSFTFSAAAQNRSIKFEGGKWSDILAKAKKENKTIYLDCYTSWCGPCKWMAKNVFTNDTAADFYNAHFIPVELDMEKGEGKDLAVKYGIRAYPTMLYLDADGNILHRTCGSSPVQTFVDNGRNALDANKQLAGYTKRFNSGNYDAAFAYTYFEMLENGCQQYDTELKNYFEKQKESDLISRSNWKMMYTYLDDYSSPAFAYFEKNRESYAKLYTTDSVQGKINAVYSAGLMQAIRKKDKAGFETLKQKVRASGNPDAEKIILQADLKQYQVDADWKSYAKTAVAYADKYAKDDAQTLNSLAWTFYEHVNDGMMLSNAEKWSKQALDQQHEYAYADTYAAVLYKEGKKTEARKAAEMAIDMAKKSGDDYKETAELLEKIKQMK